MLTLVTPLLLLTLPRRVVQSRTYFIVVRLPPPTASSPSPPLSAQFHQTHSSEETPVWTCKSGVTPLSFSNGDQSRTNARSMDLELGSEVECLDLVVTVVAAREVRLWRGETSTCRQSFQKTTTQLSHTDNGVSETFRLEPETAFSVYTERPTPECMNQNIEYVNAPTLVFRFLESHHSQCSVVSNYLTAITCNMTLSAGNNGVVAMATGTTDIDIPDFIWRMNVNSIKCSCTCRIREEYSTNNTLITTSISYNNSSTEEKPLIPESPKEEGGGGADLNMLLLVLGVLSAMLFSSIVSTVFFFHLARSLRRKLNMLKRPPSTAPPSFRPPVNYSRVHRITNECHHYNTVSLELANVLGLDQCSSERPIYQKLRSTDSHEIEC